MSSPGMLTRPIIGGVFGHGDYQLATMPRVSKGLHAVRFMVIQLAQGQVLSIAEEKREALASARPIRVRTHHASEISNGIGPYAK